METVLDPDDGGYASRKLWVALIGMALVTAGFILSGIYPVLAGSFPAMIGGISALAALYMTGNVAQNWVVAKSVVPESASAKK
jgi:hypothetical protein